MSIPIAWVDAFSDTPFRGNPAAVCLLDEAIDEARMQSLAFELGISETAYVTPAGEPGAYDLRWFTPSVEVDLCGHATLASAHALRQWGVATGDTPLTFHTRSGPLVASFEDDRIALDFPADPPVAVPLPECLRGQWPEAAVRFTGRTSFFLLVVLPTAEEVAAYVPDLAAIAATGAKALLLTAPGTHPADATESDATESDATESDATESDATESDATESDALESDATESNAPTTNNAGSGADYVLRVFGPNVGIDEDPATGSAQCAVGPWWSEALGRPGDVLIAHQLSARGAVFQVRPAGDRVRISGHATTVLTGHLC